MAQTLKFTPIAKDQLFYGRWQYCISFQLHEISALKSLDHEAIDALIERRKLWIENSRHRWHQVTWGTPGSLGRRDRDITENDIANLHTFADILIDTPILYKFVTSTDRGWIYTNDPSLIQELGSLDILEEKQYSEAVVERPKNTIKLKNPVHTHRSYLKSTKLTSNEKTQLINFFSNQQDSIRISPALASWLLTPFYRSQDYFFVDYTGESWQVMLTLVKPGLIRKTVDIIPA